MKKRLQFEVPQETFDQLDGWRDVLGMGSRAEVFRAMCRLFGDFVKLHTADVGLYVSQDGKEFTKLRLF